MKRKEKFDWGDFFSESWWWILIVGWVIFGGIEGIIKAKQPAAPKEQAVIIEVVDEKWDDYKVRFISDGTVDVVDLDNGFIVGDTVLVKR